MSNSKEKGDESVSYFPVWNGDADRYLDAVDHFARFARKHHKNGTAEWIWGEKWPMERTREIVSADAVRR